MTTFRKTFAFSVLMLLGASMILMGCNNNEQQARAEQLTEQAKVELQTAEELYDSGSCEGKQKATETLLKIDLIDQQVSMLDADETTKARTSNLAKVADDKYHEYIRGSYEENCCWATDLIIRCAENNLDSLEEPQVANLQVVKSKYRQQCELPASRSLQTAMLMR